MNNETKENGDVRLHRWISTVVTVLLVLAVVFCLYSVVQVLSKGYDNIGGFMMFRVVTGSMEPTMPTGTLLITREVDIETVALDDIVCFRTRVSEIWGKIVTHRVVDIMETAEGILLETKGDANLASDIYYVDSSNFIGKVIWHSGDGNVLADLVSLFTSKIGFLGCIALPSLILAALILKNSVGSIRHELMMVMEMERQQKIAAEQNAGAFEITEEEYNEMYERIRKELIEELTHFDEIQPEQGECSENSETE